MALLTEWNNKIAFIHRVVVRSLFLKTLHTRNCASNADVLIPKRRYKSKINQANVETAPYFDSDLINHLERLSLVRFSNEEAVAHLKEAVQYANQLKLVNTANVKPLISLLEEIECPLHDDIAEECDSNLIFTNSAELVEDYFHAPPGNIPLTETCKLDEKAINEWDWDAMHHCDKT